MGSSFGHQHDFYPDEFPSIVTQHDYDDVIHHQQDFEVPMPRCGRREIRKFVAHDFLLYSIQYVFDLFKHVFWS